MIVYGSSLSPFVRKVLVICAEKGIEVENPGFGPGVPPTPEFQEASPFGKIPALRDGDYTLADWHKACWGDHAARLGMVKRLYDPTDLFVVHHGIGSERWSSDGFVRS